MSDPEEIYDLKSVKLPYLSGRPLKAFASFLESSAGGVATSNLLNSAGITWLRRQQFDEPPTFTPLAPRGDQPAATSGIPTAEHPQSDPASTPGFHFPTVLDFATAYREGKTTPTAVAERILAAIQASDKADPPLRAFIAVDEAEVMRQAEEATVRFREKRPLSLFDGVPVAVKDELDMVPYPTTVGTSFLGNKPATQDATVVARLRAAGALLIGKTNMHEIGIGVTGQNPHHGTPRNPYQPGHYTGGSSSGSATAVAAGLCPVAIGADGGGSIRIPAAFCGVVGLKPTFGRVSEMGAFQLDWSVAHIGPLAATATDAALAYALMAGPDAHDPISQQQPAPTLQSWNNLDLSDLTLGVFWPWFRHATSDVVAACEALLNQFAEQGAVIREITIPDLEAGRVAHTLTIASEMMQAMSATYGQHRQDHALDTRINLALARRFLATDYVLAQRVRTRLIHNFNQALTEVDVIITPATGLPAPLIPATALPDGDSDLTTLAEIMRYATPANFTGHPAISFPAGYNEAGLPIGLQAMGRHWQEPTLLRLALAAEQIIPRQKPQIFFDLGI
ncbi:MAG: amidase [Anaerolineae bacterium]|nr:amidase [Anaerolineae bacterium]